MHETAEATRHLSHDVISSARSFHRTQRSHLFEDACWIGSVVFEEMSPGMPGDQERSCGAGEARQIQPKAPDRALVSGEGH